MKLKSRLIGTGEYVEVDNQMIFPNPACEKIGDIESKMLHDKNAQFSRGEFMYIASFLEAYRGLIINKTQKDRNDCCAAICRAALFNSAPQRGLEDAHTRTVAAI